MTKYTVWVCEANGQGTHHVSSHEAETPQDAAVLALYETWDDWYSPSSPDLGALHVLGICKGDVEIIEWNEICS